MTSEETIFEKAQWWKAGMLSGSDASLKAVIGYEMKVAIEAAILAEREACAKIATDFANDCRSEAKLKPVNPDYREFFSEIMAITGSSIASQIRARSNAPETLNKPLDSPENLQSITFPASVMKTCP